MSAETLEQETQLLLEAFAKYRAVYVGDSGPSRLAPYGHITLPEDNRLATFAYREMLRDHAQQLANELNRFRHRIQQLSAWTSVLPAYDVLDQLVLLSEFVDSIASDCVETPYALRNRYFFSVSHLSHQANLLTRTGWLEKKLPADEMIKRGTMLAVAQDWSMFADFSRTLNGLGGAQFTTKTNDYRNKYHHRLPPRFAHGHTQSIKRMPKKGATTYGIGAVPPLELSALLPALVQQHTLGMECFEAYASLVGEQVGAIANITAGGKRQ